VSNRSLTRSSGGAARRPAGRGLAVVELLIALSISGMVLVAVALCVDASFRAYSINQEQSDLMQRSRLAMHRVLTTIRTTDAHEPDDATARATFMMGTVVTDSGIKMIDASESPIAFKFNPTNGLLTATDGSGAEYVVLRGVEKFEIKFEPMRSQDAVRRGEPGFDRLRRATVLLTVRTAGNSVDIDETVASQSVTLSSSAVPRRNVW
jgi:hypothetical protein